ncbi:sacsin N-terminal ATP-binding-like domain-containing protein [Kitasatospora sp. NPDC017646]|uniref:sacsin N-terminal ATP-binding-like domain-containing protein n=1 Tax=Kitasatospora sp. NPDC017646 TaxID=3364024 RepID=UPI0037875EE0
MTDGAYAAELREYSLDVLGDSLGMKRWRGPEQLRAASFSTARDYAGRFLLELLQNGHDAHPRQRHDGRVHVLLDEDDGEFGTLLVGNGGTPFTWARVESVCNLAISEKVIGEGIGNKGVGFRSVLQITDAPEIYSARSEGPSPAVLDGYCFRFALEEELAALLGDREAARRAVKKLPPFQIPYPVTEVPEACAQLAEAGSVTVVRLPLRHRAALDEVRRRMQELASAKAPVMLFLDRLSSLVLERRVAGAVETVSELTRVERSLEPAAPSSVVGTAALAVSLAEVDLGPAGRFVIARHTVDDERLRSIVEEAVEEGRLDESWREWAEPAVVEVALPVAAARPRRGQTFTFLPLGEEVLAPFPGHLNAPFYTKMDRTDLDHEHPLNRLLFEVAAETCLAASEQLRGLPGPRMRQMAVDLVSWESTGPTARLLPAAARRVHDRDLSEVAIVPAVRIDGAPQEASWTTPRSATLWPEDELALLTAEKAHATGIAVVDPEVGAERVRRLAAMCRALKYPLDPPRSVLADLVERIVATMPLPGVGESVRDWDAMYADLATLFEYDGEVLRGRMILLAEDGTLRRANGGGDNGKPGQREKRRQAFFQPGYGARGDDGALVVPAVLGKRLFCLHPDLSWAENDDGGRRQRVQFFLQSAGLVRPFDAKGLLEHVRLALADSADQKLRLQALRFVFRLWRSRQFAGELALSSVGLYVPSADGALIRASGAAFGAGWTGTTGDDLATVVADGRELSSALRWIAKRLIAPPDTLVKRGETLDEWRDFLTAVGVTDGLIPVVTEGARRRANGGALTTANLLRMANLPKGVDEQWEQHLERRWSSASYPQTPYNGGHAYRLPGQEVVGRLGEAARWAYARLVLRGLATWTPEHFRTVWTSESSRKTDREYVRTPLEAFVHRQPWLPVRGADRAVRWVRPAEAWYCPPGLEEEPAFAPTVDRRLRQLLEPKPVRDRLGEAGLPSWGEPEDCARLVAALGRFLEDGAVRGDDWPLAQRANERAWNELVAQPDPELPEDGVLLAEVGDRMVAVALADLVDDSAVLYVTGDRDSLAARLIREMEQPLLVLPGIARQVCDLLEKICPGAVRAVDSLEFAATVDGELVDPAVMGEPLVDEFPWLPLAVAALADHDPHAPRPSDAALTELTGALREVRLHRYTDWEVTLDEEPVTVPDRLDGVLPLPDAKHPLLLTREGDRGWREVARFAVAMADLLGHRSFGDRVQLAALKLGDAHADLRAPAQEELARALGLSIHQLEQTGRRIDGAVGGVLQRGYPLLVHLLGRPKADELTEPTPRDTQDLTTALRSCASELPVTAEQFVDEARAARSTDELRAALGIDFGALNHTLAALAPRYRPISHGEAHEEALRAFVDLHRKELLNRLRWSALGEFDARRPLADWPELRTLDWITAPSVWALTVDVADTGLLRAQVEEALVARLGGPVPDEGHPLPPIDHVRGRNKSVIAGKAEDLAALVTASGRTLPDALSALDPGEEVTARLETAGALDFRLLGPDDVVAWLAALGQWPGDLPCTADLDRHGLTPEDLNEVRNEANRARAARERARRLISVGSRELDVHSGDFTELTAVLRENLDARPELVGGRHHFAQLTPVAPRSGGSGARHRPGGGRGRADSGLSQAQRTAIGYAGEWYAYQWLCRQYPGTDESSWVSTNRRGAFPGTPGDDGLGFDFRVGSGKQPLMFEVKATQGQGGQIELGESEVRAAQQHASHDRWRLLVITSVLDSEELQVYMLPNPFGARGRGYYREEGGALRFTYHL